MSQDRTFKIKTENREVERAKAIVYSLILIIYNHWKDQWVSDKFDYLILYGIFIWFVLYTKPTFFNWMILALVIMTMWYRYIELFLMLITLLPFKLLKTRSKEKYDKDLELMFGQSFVGKFASGQIAISELDVIFTILIVGLMIVNEGQLIDLKWLEDLLGLNITYGY